LFFFKNGFFSTLIIVLGFYTTHKTFYVTAYSDKERREGHSPLITN